MPKLQRVLIRLRWPMAVAAVLVLTATVMSRWAMFACFMHLETRHQHHGVAVGTGTVNYSRYSDRNQMDTFQFRVENTGPWHWLPYTRSQVSNDHLRVALPMWMLLLPLTALAFAGFRAKFRQPGPGQCVACRYTLAGATVCPECGQAAPLN